VGAAFEFEPAFGRVFGRDFSAWWFGKVRGSIAPLHIFQSNAPCHIILSDDFAAEAAGAGAEVNLGIGASHRFFIMLDDEERVAFLLQTPEGVWVLAERSRERELRPTSSKK